MMKEKYWVIKTSMYMNGFWFPSLAYIFKFDDKNCAISLYKGVNPNDVTLAWYPPTLVNIDISSKRPFYTKTFGYVMSAKIYMEIEGSDL